MSRGDPPPASSIRRTIGCCLALMLLAGMFWRGRVICAPRTSVAIGPETTVIAAEVRSDGRVDYAAWLNTQRPAGDVRDSNAAVVLLEVLPREEYRLADRDRALRVLKVDPDAVTGPTFLTSHAYLRQQGADRQREGDFRVQAAQARERPWTAAEFPELAAWLELNDAVLNRLVAASARDRLWMPLAVRPDEPLKDSLIVGMDVLSEGGAGLCQRSMRRLAADDVSGAWDDLVSCLRLGRLASHSPGAVFLGTALENQAHAGARAFVRSGRLTAETCRGCLADLERLPARRELVWHVDAFDRLVTLDYVQWLSTRSVGEIPLGTGVFLPGGGRMFDVNVALREVNRTYDALAAALRVDDPVQRREAVAKVHVPWNPFELPDVSWGELARLLLLSSRAGIARQVANDVLGHPRSLVESYRIIDDRLRAEGAVLRTAFALVAFHAEQQRWPDGLGELRGRDLAEVPVDPCSNAALRYGRTPTGCLLYSVGPNGADDGGAADPRNDPAGADDVGIAF